MIDVIGEFGMRIGDFGLGISDWGFRIYLIEVHLLRYRENNPKSNKSEFRNPNSAIAGFFFFFDGINSWTQRNTSLYDAKRIRPFE